MSRIRNEMTETSRRLVNLYAERNSELHVLGHDMLNALEYLGCESDVLHGFRERLHNVPQCRADEPLRRGY